MWVSAQEQAHRRHGPGGHGVPASNPQGDPFGEVPSCPAHPRDGRMGSGGPGQHPPNTPRERQPQLLAVTASGGPSPAPRGEHSG